jgi:5-methylcytosine-specific restriction endonuclease McrA
MYYYQPDVLRQVVAVSTTTGVGKKVSFLLPQDDDNDNNSKTTRKIPSGGVNNTTKKRSVSGYVKRKVAADQEWKCGHCNSTLDETYEVDHKIGLFEGGTNDPSNLIALCRNCHGKKTFAERIHSATRSSRG